MHFCSNTVLKAGRSPDLSQADTFFILTCSIPSLFRVLAVLRLDVRTQELFWWAKSCSLIPHRIQAYTPLWSHSSGEQEEQLLPRRRCCLAQEQRLAAQRSQETVSSRSRAQLLSWSAVPCPFLCARHRSSSLPSSVSLYLCLKEDQQDAFWKCHVLSVCLCIS